MMQPMRRRTSVAEVVLLGIAVVVSVCAIAVVIIPRAGVSLPHAIAPQTTPTTAPPAVPTVTPPTLHVQGTHLVDVAGQIVTLRGVSRSSLEYSCAGDGHFNQSDFLAIRSWGANAVRLTLSSEFWANAGNNCPAYHSTVAQAVANAEAAGLYVVLDLQWNAPLNTLRDRVTGGAQCPMPDSTKDLTFWRDLATIYSNDPLVFFDLFGEPHNVSWQTWRNGGPIAHAECYLISRTGGIEVGAYQSVGMSTLVRSIRTLAPQNIIIISGLDWGYQLDELPLYAIPGPNIMYGTHPFDYAGKQPTNWPTDFGDMTKTFPIIATEFGSYDCGTRYTHAAIAYFTAHQMSWMAWTWSVEDCSGPGLLADWSGTPSQPYGAYIYQQMRAANGD